VGGGPLERPRLSIVRCAASRPRLIHVYAPISTSSGGIGTLESGTWRKDYVRNDRFPGADRVGVGKQGCGQTRRTVCGRPALWERPVAPTSAAGAIERVGSDACSAEARAVRGARPRIQARIPTWPFRRRRTDRISRSRRTSSSKTCTTRTSPRRSEPSRGSCRRSRGRRAGVAAACAALEEPAANALRDRIRLVAGSPRLRARAAIAGDSPRGRPPRRSPTAAASHSSHGSRQPPVAALTVALYDRASDPTASPPGPRVLHALSVLEAAE
jgi:hypothetical protein